MPRRIIVSAPAERAAQAASAKVVAEVWTGLARRIMPLLPGPGRGRMQEVSARVVKAGRKGGRKLQLIAPESMPASLAMPYRPKVATPLATIAPMLQNAQVVGKGTKRCKVWTRPDTHQSAPVETLYYQQGRTVGVPELNET